ncbi:hypothetical protein J437_LFUL018384 [Ladona fulva]|uniref:Uncharacterized protein n=1 Tax=Ladona fulva TaxID=123851 RepID=A0A8K0P7A6_LADFU|nr:hypothetical protein J437_LFUL018384 [Ladona fulva]
MPSRRRIFCEIEDLVFDFDNGRDEPVEEEKRKLVPSMHRKRLAVEFWKSGKKGRLKLDAVRHNFSFVTSRAAKNQHLVVHDGVLFRWALEENKIMERSIPNFKATAL